MRYYRDSHAGVAADESRAQLSSVRKRPQEPSVLAPGSMRRRVPTTPVSRSLPRPRPPRITLRPPEDERRKTPVGEEVLKGPEVGRPRGCLRGAREGSQVLQKAPSGSAVPRRRARRPGPHVPRLRPGLHSSRRQGSGQGPREGFGRRTIVLGRGRGTGEGRQTWDPSYSDLSAQVRTPAGKGVPDEPSRGRPRSL